MIHKITDQMVENQVQKQMINSEEINIYRYGYILVFEVVSNIILALVMGIILRKMDIILFFLFLYIPLRSFCGGWHADKIWKCTLVSNFILLLEVLCVEYIVKNIDAWALILVFLVNIIIVICMAPVQSMSKKISEKENRVYKKKIFLIVVIHVIMMAIIILLRLQDYIFATTYVYCIQVAMLLLEKAKCKLKHIG